MYKTKKSEVMRYLVTAVATVTLCAQAAPENEIKSNIKKSEKCSYALNATGQIKNYDKDGNVIATPKPGENYYGQDANYLKGNKMTFKDNGDGTTTDLNTGLMWQKIPVSQGSTWKDAVTYCENLKLAGHDDWRIPNLKELYSISDFNSGWPYLNTKYFSLATGQVGKFEQYWSSIKYVGTTTEGGDTAAFGVNHVTGHIKAYPGEMPKDGLKNMPPPPMAQDNSAHEKPPMNSSDKRQGPPPSNNGQRINPMFKFVRAVRGAEYGANEFKDNKDGTISDTATGLMWMQADDSKKRNWQDALKYAEDAKIAGYDDWRLPNVKELQSMVDYSYAPGAKDAALDGPAVNPLFKCTSITNEAGDKDYGYYWTSTSAHFRNGEPFCYAWYVAAGKAVNNQGLDTHGAGAVRFDAKYKGGAKTKDGERYYNFVRLVRDIK